MREQLRQGQPARRGGSQNRNAEASPTAARSLRRSCSRLSAERGAISLVELVVVMPIVMFAIVASLGLFRASAKTQDRSSSRARTVLQERNAIEKITRDLRQATRFFDTSSAESVEFEAWIKPAGLTETVLRRIRYDCASTAGSCFRTEGAAGQPAPLPAASAGLLLNGVQNTDIFVLEPSRRALSGCAAPCAEFNQEPTFACVKLAATIKTSDPRLEQPAHPLVLRDGVELRNVNPSSSYVSCTGATPPVECGGFSSPACEGL